MMKKYESPEFSLKKYMMMEVVATTSAEEKFDNIGDDDLIWGDDM